GLEPFKRSTEIVEHGEAPQGGTGFLWPPPVQAIWLPPQSEIREVIHFTSATALEKKFLNLAFGTEAQPQRLQDGPADDREHPHRSAQADPGQAAGDVPGQGLRLRRGP